MPLAILIVLMMILDYSPAYSALIASAVTIATLCFVSDERRLSVRVFSSRFRAGLIDAAKQTALIAAIIICAGLIVGVFNITGLGIKITSLILDLSGGRLWIALLLTAAACTILGMELPTTAAYLICVSVSGPALIKLGLPELHTHMFVFWYALLCTITPPVCGTVFVAAGIAGAHWLTVAFQAMRIGLGLFIIPLGFVANPALLALADRPVLALAAFFKIGAGLWLISYGVIQEDILRLRVLLALAAGVATIFLLPIV